MVVNKTQGGRRSGDSFKYQAICDSIISYAIKSHESRLPSEKEICRIFDVSRTTAKRALNFLAEKKMVRREVGRGTFLVEPGSLCSITVLLNNSTYEVRDFFEKASEAFSGRYPNVQFSFQAMHDSDRVTPLVRTPGVKLVVGSNLGYLSAMGLLTALDGFEGFTDLTGTINSKYMSWRKDTLGNLRCDSLPLAVSPSLFAFDQNYAEFLGLDAEHGPKTWGGLADWINAAKGLRRKSRKYQAAVSFHSRIGLPLSYYGLLSAGDEFLQEHDGEVKFVFPHGERWISFFHEIYNLKGVRLAERGEPCPMLFGRELMTLEEGPYLIGQTRRFNTKHNIRMVPIPVPEAGMPNLSQFTTLKIGFARDYRMKSHDYEMAWEFISFLISETDIQRTLAFNSSFIPVHYEISELMLAEKEWRPFFNALEKGKLRTDHPVQHSVMKIVKKYFYDCIEGLITPRQAVEMITEACRLQIEIERERWLPIDAI